MSYNNSNYYKGGASGLNRGGRGGSFRSRGGSDSGSGWQSRGRGRGNFSSGATRGSATNWYNKPSSNFNKSYNDRNSSGNRDNSDRFSSRGSESDYSHRYSRQGNADNYSARNDHSHHRSPDDVPRKRMRTDSYSGDTNRRGHDGGFDSYGSNRYDNFNSDKSNYGGGEDRVRPVYRDDRRSSATRREDFSQRPRETTSTSMPPPSQTFRSTTFRGRGGTRGRGATRGGFTRRQDTFVSPRSRLVDSFKAKKRLVMTKPDFFKTKLQKLRSFGVNRASRKEPRPRDEVEEENWNEEVTDKDVENGQGKGEKLTEKKKRPVKIVKKIIKKVVVKKEPKPAEETPADAEPSEKKEEVKEQSKEGQKEVAKELEEGEEEGEEEEVVEEELEVEEEEVEEVNEKDAGSKSDSKVKEGRTLSEDGSKKTGESFTSHRSYIKLQCPHCRTSCLTFRDYHDHLRSSKHIFAMREVSLSMKQTLMRMRTDQRAKQRVIEEAEELQGISSTHTNFCPTCKLNYRQDRERHITSEMHKKMKDYLMPFCTICRISFKSPMLYENHICSLEHIRAKDSARKSEQEKGSSDDEKDVDMDSLLILDSVGSADESGESEEEADKEKVEGTKGKKKEKKHEINLGADYVRKVQVLYCDLCEMYLPRREQLDTALTSHCRTRNHLQRYVRYRDDCHLRREAERIHRRDQAEQEAQRNKALKDSESGAEKKTEKPEDAAEKSSSSDKPEETKATEAAPEEKEVKKEPATPNPKSTSTAAAPESSDAADSEDKLWADVDKGLDELLREVAPGCKSSDEDEDSGRYDRFKHSKDEAAAEGDAAAKKEAEPEKSEPVAE